MPRLNSRKRCKLHHIDAICDDLDLVFTNACVERKPPQRIGNRKDTGRAHQGTNNKPTQSPVAQMSCLCAAQCNRHRHLEPFPEQRRGIATRICEMSVNEVKPKAALDPAHREQATKRHENSVKLSESTRDGDKARVVNPHPLLNLEFGCVGPIPRVSTAYQPLQRKPSLRRNDHNRQVLSYSEHTFTNENSCVWFAAVRKQRRKE